MRRLGMAMFAAWALLLTGTAEAGTYTVTTCAPGATNRAWLPFNSVETGFDVDGTCPTLSAFSEPRTGSLAGFFQAAGVTFTAPGGTVIDGLTVWRGGYRFLDRADNGNPPQGGWITEAFTEDGVIRAGFSGETCQIPSGQSLCGFGTNGPDQQPKATYDLEADRITYQVACIRQFNADGSPGNCNTAFDSPQYPNFPIAGITIERAEVTLRDNSAPALSVGGPFLEASWQRPGEEVTFDASDNVGIRALNVTGGGAGVRSARPCDYTRPAPCSNVSAARVPVSGIGDGVHRVVITAEDAAGNPRSVERTVSVDGTPPAARLERSRGRQISVVVDDELSGVQGGEIFARRNSAKPYVALRTRLRRGRLRAFAPRGMRAASADVRINLRDNAGNAASGPPVRLDVTSAQVGRRFSRVRQERVSARYGTTTLRGRLTLSAGQPLGGQRLVATAAERRGRARRLPAGETVTDAKGRFALSLPAGPSRNVKLTFAGVADAPRAIAAVSVRVPATSTIRASRRLLSGPARVRFSGRVQTAGRRLGRGLLLVLQGREGGRWRTFAETRTDRRGRWRTSYRFRGVPGTYPIRALIRRQTGFAFELGHSRPVTVRIR